MFSFVMLYLHHAIMIDDEKNQIKAWADQAGISDRLIMTDVDMAYMDDRGMNEIYNACDIGINTSLGEGWGLVSMEHAAAGKAQIVPDHSACKEIWRDFADCIPVTKNYVPEFSILELAEISVEGAVASLEKLYQNESYRHVMAVNAYDHVTRPEYQWSRIANQWDKIFCDAMGK